MCGGGAQSVTDGGNSDGTDGTPLGRVKGVGLSVCECVFSQQTAAA